MLLKLVDEKIFPLEADLTNSMRPFDAKIRFKRKCKIITRSHQKVFGASSDAAA